MINHELSTTWSGAGLVALSSILMLLAVIVIVRVAGLRSFSKMSSFDFAVTVAFGSLLAGVALSSSSLIDGIVAAATLITVQAVIAWGRTRWNLGAIVDNQPLLLMDHTGMIDEALAKARVTADDVRAKLRAANVRRYADVDAVVLETTGDISVLHGTQPLEPDLLNSVAGSGSKSGSTAP